VVIMVMLGHTYKEIERKVKKCVIENGTLPEDCIREIERDYELDEEDKLEILEIARNVGKF
jgi:hypothetical protein